MPLLKFGDWRPDVSDYEGSSAHNILNVYPRGDGYGPVPSLSTYTQNLPAPCRGGFFALKSDGSVVVFAGTATKLYKLNNTSYNWDDVSLSGGSYSSLTSTAQWQFDQCGSLVFATQANAVLQVFDLSSASTFVNALGSPPQAAYITVVGSFLVLSGLLSNPYRIQWSGLNSFNASASWTAGINSSSYQDFTDGGIVRGVGGGEFGVIFQDQAIRRMVYVPGNPVIFQIDRVAEDKGLLAPYSIIRAGEIIFFYSNQGFQKITPGGMPEQIGRERVDRTFLTNLDRGNLQLFIGAADPKTSRVYWAYKSVSGQAGFFDTIIGYDFMLDRWFQISQMGEYLLGISQTGLTLEGLDAIAPTPLMITGAANNGSGKVRLTLAAESNSNFTILGQNSIEIYGVVGTTEANGNFPFTVVDSTHIDLPTVTFVNAYISGGQIGGSLDAMTLSLDAYATAVQPEIAMFTSANALSFFRGTPLEGTIETGEQGTDGQRIYLNGFRPIVDAPSVFGSASYRETQQATPTYLSETTINARTGRCDLRTDTRYSRMKVRVPAGTILTFAAGVEPDITQTGMQ